MAGHSWAWSGWLGSASPSCLLCFFLPSRSKAQAIASTDTVALVRTLPWGKPAAADPKLCPRTSSRAPGHTLAPAVPSQ